MTSPRELLRRADPRRGPRPGTLLRPTTRAEQSRFLDLLTPERISQPLIRLGGSADGGYLIPDDIDGIVGAISPGVADEISFDEELAARGIRVAMLDASVDGPPTEHPLFTFQKLYLDSYSSATTTTIDVLAAAMPPGDLLLEIDIEGAEYRVIHQMPKAVQERFRIIVAEFHHLTDLRSASRYADISSAVEKLLTTHRVVHVHLNNHVRSVRLAGETLAEVIEVTFHRRDRSDAIGGRVTLPHPLDADCTTELPPLPLPARWL